MTNLWVQRNGPLEGGSLVFEIFIFQVQIYSISLNVLVLSWGAGSQCERLFSCFIFM